MIVEGNIEAERIMESEREEAMRVCIETGLKAPKHIK